jgi:hypothetical protein
VSAILLNITMGLALSLLLRRPARRLFGPGPASTLWMLLSLTAVLPLLPVTPLHGRSHPSCKSPRRDRPRYIKPPPRQRELAGSDSHGQSAYWHTRSGWH